MSEGASNPEKQEGEITSVTREPWTKPTVTRLRAADAETFTRPTNPDGQLTHS